MKDGQKGIVTVLMTHTELLSKSAPQDSYLAISYKTYVPTNDNRPLAL